MKPWMIAAFFGTLVGLTSRRWLTVEMGRGKTFERKGLGAGVTVIVGIGNTINYNLSNLPSDKESSHAEGA